MTLAACGEPSADVVAVWVDGAASDEGNRLVRVYEAGGRDIINLETRIPRTGVDLLQIGIDSRARGVALGGTESTVWIERGSGRRVTMDAAAVGRDEALADVFGFSRNGDAIFRSLEVGEEDLPALLFAPLSGPRSLETVVLEAPGPASPGMRWVLHHASDAPVLVWAEVGDSPPAPSGRVVAMAYPSDYGQGPLVDDLRPLGQGELFGRGVEVQTSVFLAGPGCAERMCVAPSGRVVYTMVNDSSNSCDLWRWSWVEAESTGAITPPEAVAIACPGGREAMLSAVLDDDLVVLDDAHRIYLIDRSAGTSRSVPKPVGALIAALADRGRVMLVSASTGELIRVDARGPRLVNGVQTPCTFRDGVAISPGGGWVVQSCNGQTNAPDGVDGLVVRISALGAELYTGVPMRPIAIDDDGNALLYSISSTDEDGVPRGLFVLTDDGQLTRTDELEPFPAQVRLTPGVGAAALMARFSAAGPA